MILSTDGQSSGNMELPISHDCIFCRECSSRRFEFNVPVVDSANFFVLADIAPVAFGHLIIVPKRHVSSLAELDLSDLAELVALVGRLHSRAATALDGFPFPRHGSIRA